MTSVYEGDELVKQYETDRPSYPGEVVAEVLKFLDEQNPDKKPRGFILDVGCGGGKATIQFAPHFEQVLGIDISTSQINIAKKTVPNIEFQIGSASSFPVESGSVDLIIAGTAAHYFDLDVFLPECDRVLRPGGCVSLFVYRTGKLKTQQGKIIGGSTIDSGVSRVIMRYSKEIGINSYIMDAMAELYQPIYDRINKSCKRLIKGIESEKQFTLDEYVSYLGTIGEYRANKHRLEDNDPLATAKSGIEVLLGITDDNRAKESIFKIIYEYGIVLFRK